MQMPETVQAAIDRLEELRPLAEPRESGGRTIDAFSESCKSARQETWSIIRVWLPSIIDLAKSGITFRVTHR